MAGFKRLFEYRRLSCCHDQRILEYIESRSPTQNVGVNAGHEIVKQIYHDMHIRRTMRTPQTLPNSKISFPAIDLLPSTVVVEETQHDPTNDLAALVESMGKANAKRLYSQNKLSSIMDMQNNSSSMKVAGDSGQVFRNSRLSTRAG
ncbi:uncharacterized protein B0J16DRAFT_321223 [Fusarium flagelliforme]|uniref:uncharacterized protein n=1 Tax=Fusarium flagelliforme TaxID=2675880 RepID=UPI001E8E1371|nr:uncharacterized protein B0J16DRAFT_321223 [Fusarium flagelliforme]KAH7182441.1 hypothetical protein B0J16DRAFT_321223 [Fusarium flagelliforme]